MNLNKIKIINNINKSLKIIKKEGANNYQKMKNQVLKNYSNNEAAAEEEVQEIQLI
jgi:hypothetical protein